MTNHTLRFASHDARWPCSENPLVWWKTKPAESLGSDGHKLLQRTLQHFVLLGIPQWRDAAQGDAIAAIGIAIPAIRTETCGSPRLDLVMSSILLCTLSGSSAAAVVLAYALRKQNIDQSRNPLSSARSLAASKFDGNWA